ncbi:hypothetical protein FO519_001394 [Halicephalobus sp. NKZ332]|nr:hypothetical protein FO519_001394 [Halicephalobus sp. NKZ332]
MEKLNFESLDEESFQEKIKHLSSTCDTLLSCLYSGTSESEDKWKSIEEMYEKHVRELATTCMDLKTENGKLKHRLVDNETKITQILNENEYLRWENEQFGREMDTLREQLGEENLLTKELQAEIKCLQLNQKQINQLHHSRLNDELTSARDVYSTKEDYYRRRIEDLERQHDLSILELKSKIECLENELADKREIIKSMEHKLNQAIKDNRKVNQESMIFKKNAESNMEKLYSRETELEAELAIVLDKLEIQSDLYELQNIKLKVEKMDGENITRASVGRVAHVGDLYDARSETFCGISILKKPPPPTTLQTTDNNDCKIEYVHSDTFSEKFEKLSISAELKLSILAGAFTLAGHGQYLSDEKKSARAVRSSLVYTINTKVEHLNLTSEDLKDCLELNTLKNDRGTHVVVDVCWGANAAIIMESMNSESKDNTEVEGALSGELKKIAAKASGKIEVDYKKNEEKKETNFSFRVFADVLPAGDLPQTVEGAIELMKKIPALAQEANDGKGKPIKYIMVPISTLKSLLNKPELMADRLVKQLNEEAIARFVELFDEISELKQKLNDLYNDMVAHKFCVLEDDVKKASKIRTLLNRREASLRSKLAATLIEVRSGRADAEQLENILEEFEGNDFSLSKVRSDINSFHNVVEKIKFADILKAEGATYIGLGSSLETEMIKNEMRDIYILFFSDTLKQTENQAWRGNRTLFFSLMRSEKSGTGEPAKFFVVDLDLRPEIGISENVGAGIKICHYKNGKYVSYDVQHTQHEQREIGFADYVTMLKLKKEEFIKSLLNKIGDTYPGSDDEKLRAEARDKFGIDSALKCNFAITGESGVGKSTFINFFCGYDAKDPRAAKTGITECTSEMKGYHSINYDILVGICHWKA